VHLFNCCEVPSSFSLGDLWANPVEVSALLAEWGGEDWLELSGRAVLEVMVLLLPHPNERRNINRGDEYKCYRANI